jgi:uncharacterized protein (TIGR04255 family)
VHATLRSALTVARRWGLAHDNVAKLVEPAPVRRQEVLLDGPDASRRRAASRYSGVKGGAAVDAYFRGMGSRPPPKILGRLGCGSSPHFPSDFPKQRMGSKMGSVVTTPFGPPVEEVPLPRAPLVFVVAQARFERIASISSEDFIAGFQEAIRNAYPVMQRGQQAGMLIGSDGHVVTADAGILWRFDERPEGWQVVLAPDFVALSTKQYTRRQDFIDRFSTVLSAAQQALRIRFCDRLGIRYVDRTTDGAVLSRLAEVLKPVVLGAVGVDLGEPEVEHVHNFVDTTYRLPGATELHARWGVLPPAVTFDPAIEAADARSWVLDLDAYSTEQAAFDPLALASRATALTERIYRFFRWAVEDEFLVAHGGHP